MNMPSDIDVFNINEEMVVSISQGIQEMMTVGLEGTDGLKMLPSFLFQSPCGQEKGTYVALDLGGTNFRVVQVDLLGNGEIKTEYSKYTIPEELKTGHGDKLFDFIARCVKDFVTKRQLEESSLGFTFSFPCEQLSINEAVLMHWAKGFTAHDVEGQDVVRLLHEAFEREMVHIKCRAVINDTVGTLLSHAYKSPATVMGVILGTGTNAAYIEQCSEMTKSDDIATRSGPVLVNIEWGAFGNDGKYLPFSKYDDQLDAATANPGQQRFEKMTSGLYLGEIVRLALIDLIEHGVLLRNRGPGRLGEPWSFPTKYLSQMESDKSDELDEVTQVLDDMGVKHSTLEERQVVKEVARRVGKRSARLAGAAIAGVLQKSKVLEKGSAVVVAIDGSLFEHYPHYKSRIEVALEHVLGSQAYLVSLELARDGSSVGAALGSLMAIQ